MVHFRFIYAKLLLYQREYLIGDADYSERKKLAIKTKIIALGI